MSVKTITGEQVRPVTKPNKEGFVDCYSLKDGDILIVHVDNLVFDTEFEKKCLIGDPKKEMQLLKDIAELTWHCRTHPGYEPATEERIDELLSKYREIYGFKQNRSTT